MNCEICVMVMISSPDGSVLLLDRKKKTWPGITFPGGHVEPGEGIFDAAKREALEETGLEIRDPKLCGIVHWAAKSGDRYLEFLFTSEADGKPVGSGEGEVFFAPKEYLSECGRLSEGFSDYLPLFFNGDGKVRELRFDWSGSF